MESVAVVKVLEYCWECPICDGMFFTQNEFFDDGSKIVECTNCKEEIELILPNEE